MPYLSIIIPCYNEERRLKKNLAKKLAYFGNQKYSWEFVLVDDGSTDKTKKIMLAEKDRNNHLKIVSYQKNQGKGYAIKKGMLAAEGKYRLFTDSDDSTEISQVEKLLKYKDKFEVIIASRYLAQSNIKIKQGFLRRLVSRAGNLFIKILLGLKYQDTQCGFKLFSQKSPEEIFSRSKINRWGFDIEILTLAEKLGYEIKEVPVNWRDTADSKLRPVKAASQVFFEAIKIKMNLLFNRYK